MPKISELTTAIPTSDDFIVFVDNADSTTKKSLVSSLPTGTGDMLIATYDPAGVSQQVVGTTATQTVSGKTLTAPKFVDNGFIADSNGNEMVSFNLNASAVNYLEIENGATANPPHIRAKGDDTNVGLHLVGKGTGEVSVCDATDETKRIRFQASGNSTGVTTTIASSDTTSHTITLPNATDTLVGKATPDTLTNKRITNRIGTEASSATSTPTADSVDQWNITALAAADAIAAPTGTPTDGQSLILRIKDNGTARALTWNAIYRASTDLALPTTTVISKTMYCEFLYNSADSKWDFVGFLNNF